jgi:crossover junction endodeoxyribonuclease RusA
LLEALRQTTTHQYKFFVAGQPASQGSKTAMPRIIRDQSGRQRAIANMIEQDKNLKPWRFAVAQVAKLMLPSDWKTDGVFMLGVIFFLQRPKTHYAANGSLKRNAPVFHAQHKDCDKMIRAIGDALTGTCYDDDALIVSVTGLKLFSTPEHQPGAWISVGRLDEQAASAATRLLID